MKLKDLHSQLKTASLLAASAGAAEDASRCFAKDGFALATGQARVEPPDAMGEPPSMVGPADAVGANPIVFSIERFRTFDASAITAETVEPIDGSYRQFGARCLVLRNCLSPDECAYLTQQMEGNLEQVQYRKDYRNNERCIFDSSELADLLWQRVEPFASELAVTVGEDFTKQHLVCDEPSGECPDELRLGYGLEGTWQPFGLNDCLRFCKYNAGGFFRKHCDAMFERSEDVRSLFTCMFYLNGDFEGGATNFLDPEETLTSAELERAKDSEVVASVPPETGLCLLFFQRGLLHEGADLHSGLKYILRTEVMFRRDPSSKPIRTERQLEAFKLSKQAQAAEERGDCDLACQLYRRAFKMDPHLERLL